MRSLSPKDIGAIVRQARTEAGLTQEALAAKIGASRYWVADFERGKARAELGLTLKALRALRMSLTIEPWSKARHERSATSPTVATLESQPVVDLSRLLARSTNLATERK